MKMPMATVLELAVVRLYPTLSAVLVNVVMMKTIFVCPGIPAIRA
jgi:hypothetical protein